MTQEEIQHRAEAVRAGGTPDFLNRWLTMTPESLRANEEILEWYRQALLRGVPVTRWREEASMGSKEAALRAMREETTTKPEATAPGQSAPEVVPTTETTVKTKTTTKAKAAKKAKATTTRRAAAPKKGAARNSARKPAEGGIKAGSKLAAIVDLLKRKEGCTTADVLAATGWPSVSMPQQAKAAGLKLKTEKEGRTTRYWAAE